MVNNNNQNSKKKKKNVHLAITGNPGVGKHTCAKLVAEELGNCSIIDINQVAIKGGAIINDNSNDADGLDVDVKKLKRILAAQLNKIKESSYVIVGHLAPYVLEPSAISMVAVLRRSPYLLLETFGERGYTDKKARENASSEILGVSFYDALKKFGRIKMFEIDTTAMAPQQVANEVISAVLDKSKRQAGVVDWLSLVSDKDDIEKFFGY